MTLDPIQPPGFNFALDEWKLQLPIDSAGTYLGDFIEQKDLRDYSRSGIFFTDPESGAMVLSAPVDGARTTNGHFARCELREWTAGGENAWSLADGGRLDVTLQVNEVPTLREGGAAPIVVGQIHSETIATPVRIYYADGSVYWVHGRNEAVASDVALPVLDEAGRRPDIALGETFSYTIEVKDDVLVVRVVADGVTYQSGVVLNEGWQDDLVYFKAGCYLATDEAESSGWGRVSILGLNIDHDLAAAPALPGSALPSIDGALSDYGLPARLKGTDGDDLFLVSNAGSVVHAGLGEDTVYALSTWAMTNGVERLVLVGSEGIGATGREFADTIAGNGAGNLIAGAGGDDGLSGRGGDDRLFGGQGDDVVAGNTGQDGIDGGDGGDRLYGGFGNDTVRGGGGEDQLDGGAGRDLLIGGAGDDVYTVDPADEVREDAGAGIDLVLSAQTFHLTDHVEDLVLLGGGDLSGTGNAEANRLTGNDGRNTLDGGAGLDELRGGAGDDVYIVDRAGEAVERRGGGWDKVWSWVSYRLDVNLEMLRLLGDRDLSGTGNGQANRMLGNAGANLLSGLGGDDWIAGGGGNDVLDGGRGIDTLTGGAGADAFVIVSRSQAGDVIADFHGGAGDGDAFHVVADGFGGSLWAGDDVTAAQFQIVEAGDPTSTTARSTEVRFLWERDDTRLWFDQNGSRSGGLVLVADLQDGASLTRGDLILV